LYAIRTALHPYLQFYYPKLPLPVTNRDPSPNPEAAHKDKHKRRLTQMFKKAPVTRGAMTVKAEHDGAPSTSGIVRHLGASEADHW
jgi:hypothetical protein